MKLILEAYLHFLKKQITEENNQNRATNISIFENSAPENLPIHFPAIWLKLQDLNDRDAAKSWKDLTPSMTAIDQKTGRPIMDMSVIDQLPLTIGDKETTFGEHFTNSKGQAVGIRAKVIQDRNKNQVNWESTNNKIEAQARDQLEEEWYVPCRPTLLQLTLLKHNVCSLNKLVVKLAQLQILVSMLLLKLQRNNEAQRIMSKPDDQLTQQDVDAAEAVMPADQAKVIKQRYADNVGQYHTKGATKIVGNATAVIKGKTDFGLKLLNLEHRLLLATWKDR